MTPVAIRAEGTTMEGMLDLPATPVGVVLFAHGSGSSRHSPRNGFVARQLGDAGIGTLLIDLLSTDEDRVFQHRFDIDLLSRRLAAAVAWLRQEALTAVLPLGLFGASTGAAAALRVAAQDDGIAAVVSRGGRPDLADTALARVDAPSLLIVGGDDGAVIELNRMALSALRCEKEFVIVPGAGHLFEEPGTLAQVAQLACAWFLRHFMRSSSPGTTRNGNLP